MTHTGIRLTLLLIILFFSAPAQGQEEEAAVDIITGAGISNEGLSGSAGIEMTMLGLVTGLRASAHGFLKGSGSFVSETALLAGYRHTERSFSSSITLGYSLAGYRCLGDAEACSRYSGGLYSGLTGQLQLTKMFGRRAGLTLSGFAVLNKRSDIYTAMLMFNFRL